MDNRNVIVKWTNCCRLCLLDDGIKLHIFEEEGIQRQVARKIETCFPILIYVGDPLPKMICHKCLYKLDTVYDFRLRCLEANTTLKTQLLTLTHIAEVKQYLDTLESASCVRKEQKATEKPLHTDVASPVSGQVTAPEPVIPSSKSAVAEEKMGPVQLDSSSENVFQEVFLADCSSDVFFPEQTPDENVQGNENGNNLAKPLRREQTVSVALASSPVDTCASFPAVKIKQEPQDDTMKEEPRDEFGEPRNPVKSQPSPPRNDTLPRADLEPLPVNLQKVKQEKMDTAGIECSKCKIRFQDNEQLQKHLCSVSQWSCEHCNKYFKSKDTLYKHKKYFCPKKKNSCICKGCGKLFSSLIEMAQHQKVHLRVCISLQEENLFTCTVCRKKFAARSMLEMHKKSHSSVNLYMNQTEGVSAGKVLVKRFKCQYCPSCYTRRDKLKIHMKSHFVGEKKNSMPEWSMESRQTNTSDAVPQSSKKCSCKYCEYVCDDSAALWLHMLQQHSSEKAYKCNKCGRGFNHLHAYSNHKKTHNVKISCRVCGKPYSSSKALREHEYNKHSIQKAPHHCRLCTESFVTRSALLIHGRIHHTKGKNDAPLLEEAEMKVGTLPCSLCSERFPSPMALVAHMQTHIGIGMGNRDVRNENMGNLDQGSLPQSSCEKEEEHQPLTCKICFKLFSSKSGLQRHVKIHATGKHVFYPCKVCGKKFVSESTYEAHAATHMVSKSFHCRHCNKIFFKEDVFKCHICENTEKQACLTCGVLLTEEQHLNHVCEGSILKSSQLLVRCAVCPAVFSSTKARNNHMRIHGRQLMLTSSLPPNLKSMFVKMSNGLYKCNLCGKLTTTQQGAAGHSRWHTCPQPVKQYHCPFCNRRYTTETGLYTHITAEHPEMPG